MQRINRWGGQVSDASPYAIPPGGAQRQCNFTITTPGQLTSRNGMEELIPAGAGVPAMVEQMWTISGGAGKADRLVLLDSLGQLAIIDSVAR